MAHVNMKVDGVSYEDEVEPRLLLVHHLRDRLGKVGTASAATPATAAPARCSSTATA